MADIPTLLSFLQDKHTKHQADTDPMNRPRYEGVAGFVAFCEAYLAANPPVGVSYPGIGIAISLADSSQVMLAGQPGDIVAGGMEPANAVPIMKGGDGSIKV